MANEMYGRMARWWPLLSPVEEYVEEAAWVGVLLDTDPLVREVLELGSGGGHLASHLTARFRFTFVDASAEMLAVSRALHPGAEHVEGDMRSVRLDRTFDAVLIHDAVSYATTLDALAEVLATAAAHLRPGGRVVLVPDELAETFAPGTDCGGTDHPDGSGVRYLEWTFDGDPTDTWAETVYTIVARDADGALTTVSETHRGGVFPRAAWLAALARAGFDGQPEPEPPFEEEEPRPPRTAFVGTLLQ